MKTNFFLLASALLLLQTSAFADCRLEVSDDIYGNAFWSERLIRKGYYPVGKSLVNSANLPTMVLAATTRNYNNSPSENAYYLDLSIRDRTGVTLSASLGANSYESNRVDDAIRRIKKCSKVLERLRAVSGQN